MKTIRQTATIRGANPHDIYETLLDSKKHAKLTGSSAKIGRRVGQAWTAYGTGLSGKQLALTKDRKITQSWRESDWPKGLYSRATFSLARTKGGTRITFRQSGVPAKSYRSISSGWREYYWEPLKKAFAK
jgi:activator of HSP90 ATPase